MVLCFEESQREEIERNYGSIIECKRMLYKVRNGLTNCCKAFYEALKEVVDRVTKVIKEVYDKLQEALEKFCDFDIVTDISSYAVSDKSPLIKITRVTYYTPNDYDKYIKLKTVLHHCRNNC